MRVLFNCTYANLNFTFEARAVCAECKHTTLLGQRTCPFLIKYWEENGDTATGGVFSKMNIAHIPRNILHYAYILNDEGLEWVSIDFDAVYRDACIAFSEPSDAGEFIDFIQTVRVFETEWDSRPHCGLRLLEDPED